MAKDLSKDLKEEVVSTTGFIEEGFDSKIVVNLNDEGETMKVEVEMHEIDLNRIVHAIAGIVINASEEFNMPAEVIPFAVLEVIGGSTIKE